jgi:hypothetical protein
MSYDHMVIGTGNSDHPANLTDVQIEKMTDLEYAEYERNRYQKRCFELSNKLNEIKELCEQMQDNGLAVLILNKLK